ncbi:hypothetical protein GGU11DRAFT_243006 [Lentinula aff. detonsa]|nr:hypothetical protein GGU11DRAFT_243006 [Lentinula aff. detonsa]
MSSSSTSPASSSSNALFDGRSPGWNLDSQTIEEIMEELYAALYGNDSQASGVLATSSEDNIFRALYQKAHPWSGGQQRPESPRVIFAVSIVHGEEILRPMVPVRKTEYFDMEAFENAQCQRLVSDMTAEILWSKRYSVELSFGAGSQPSLTCEEIKVLDQYFDSGSFVRAQRQKPSGQPVQTTEELAFWKRMNGVVRTDEQLQHDSPTRHARLSTETQWRDIVLNYSALPPAIFPDVVFGANQDSEGLRMCFVDSEGQRHYTNIVLSDQYMLVSLPSESVTDRLVWDSYGVHIPTRINGPLSTPCFVDPQEVCTLAIRVC